MNVQYALHKKQLQALKSPASEILYGGCAGGGKSHLARVLSIFFCLQIPNLQVYFFRRNYQDLIKGHIEGETGFRSLLQPFIDRKLCDIVELEIRFSNGSKIYLNHCQHEKDVYKYKSQEFHILVVEESTQFTEPMIRFLRTRVRLSEQLKQKIPERFREKLPMILYTTNPGDVGHEYFKRNFVTGRESGEIWQAPDDDGGFTRQFIKALLADNPSLDPVKYARNLKGLGSPELVRAFLEGDWDAIVGAFFPEWSQSIHVVPDFVPPKWWFKFRSFDWGSAAPAAVLWWCVSDGSLIKANNGAEFYLPKGALICYREWYVCDGSDYSKGLHLSNEQLSKGILERSFDAEIHPNIVTDSLPFQSKGGKTIAQDFGEWGLRLVRGDTSRVQGWSQVRGRLIGIDGFPLLYATKSCYHFQRTIPILQADKHDQEDAETTGEDHLPDAARLACMTRPLTKNKPSDIDPKIKPDKPKFNQLLSKHMQRQRAIRNGGY